MSPLSISRTFSSPVVVNSDSHSPLPPPWGTPPQFCFLPLWTWLLWAPRISRIIQYLSFCDRLISLSLMSLRFILVTTCVRISFHRQNKCMDTKGESGLGWTGRQGLTCTHRWCYLQDWWWMRVYCRAQGALLNALWSPKWEGNPQKRGWTYMCNWFTLLYIRN